MLLQKESGGGDFKPAPAGTHNAVLVDVVGPVTKQVTWQGQVRDVDKLRIVWQIDEINPEFEGRYIVSQWYTATLHEKGNLCQMLEGWAGKPLPSDAPFDTESLIGRPCIVNVVHRESNGKTYANVQSVSKLPKGMTPIQPDGTYTRVQDRQEEVVQDVRTATQPTPIGEVFRDESAFDADDELPF